MPNTQDIVQKLWNLCNVLSDDGISYLQYVTELTYLLFLKMAKETGTEDQLPKGYRWDPLAKKDGVELLEFCKLLLVHLGGHGSARVQAIFANATTSFRQPRNLRTVVEAIDGSIGTARSPRGSVTCKRGCWRRTPRRPRAGQASISRRGRSSSAWSPSSSRRPASACSGAHRMAVVDEGATHCLGRDPARRRLQGCIQPQRPRARGAELRLAAPRRQCGLASDAQGRVRETCLVIIDTNGNGIGRAWLWHDFAALEFLFGTPLRLDTLVGVNEKNEAVAAYGASFGYRFRPNANRDPPLPDDRAGAWIAVAFSLVARALANPQPYDIERDARRVRIVRTLVAATVLRHVGYCGPLAGWDLDEQGWRKPADWFPASDAATAEAQRIYEATSMESNASE